MKTPKTTRITINTGHPERHLDAKSYLQHVAACLSGQEVHGFVVIEIAPDGRVFLDNRQVYQPPRPMKPNQRRELEAIT